MSDIDKFKQHFQSLIRELNRDHSRTTPCGIRLHPTHAHILMVIYNNEKKLLQSEIALKLGIDKSNITRACDYLQKEKLIIRVASIEDKRSKEIQLTQKGKRIAKTSLNKSDQFISLLYKNIPSKDIKAVVNAFITIEKITNSFRSSEKNSN